MASWYGDSTSFHCGSEGKYLDVEKVGKDMYEITVTNSEAGCSSLGCNIQSLIVCLSGRSLEMFKEFLNEKS